MNIRDCMSSEVKVISPAQTLQEAARSMMELDVGALPVGENDRLVGMITDRDIVVRAVSLGLAPNTSVRDVMSKELMYCFDDQDINTVARNMGELKVRRLPVVDRDKRLVGIISMGDLANGGADNLSVAETLTEISQPGGRHSQQYDSIAASARH